ncbi:Membrane-associated progesterone receptor component [Seminavis robusta]|uniref:Membrane-associated progesterone receptor component n=1 Tax=Seminavis robusta TaxID=568900 RepID=A0A9N8ELV2_9STRA|nr:Membrane-associated progesterone receptor component [Seminavis robusta]|eukprot:Sro1424_g271490.1 Membrane-associated progesterone receptor component (220) ;mRNA; r:21274-21933
MVSFPGWLVWALVGVATATAAVHFNQDSINMFFMRLFRDIGRHKAYKRRYGSNEYALTTFLLQQEDPLLGVDEREDHLPTYTVDELWEIGNVEEFEDAEEDEPRKLLLSIFGRIYDVTKGTKFYGPDSSYSMFCGRDVTYALSTGCKTEKCLASNVDELSDKQLDEGKRWLSFFQLHDKYPLVGKLDNSPMESMMNQWIDEIVANKDKEGAGQMPPLNF